MSLKVFKDHIGLQIEYGNQKYRIRTNPNGSCLYQYTATGPVDISYTPLTDKDELLVWAGEQIGKLPKVTTYEDKGWWVICVNDQTVSHVNNSLIHDELLARVYKWVGGFPTPEFMSEDARNYAAQIKRNVEGAL